MENKYTLQNIKLLIMTLFVVLVIFLLVENMDFNLFILLAITLLGVVNGIFWFYILTKDKMQKIVVIIIMFFTWPILSVIGTITLFPIIIFDIIHVLALKIRDIIYLFKK